jgi:hypothetical protein
MVEIVLGTEQKVETGIPLDQPPVADRSAGSPSPRLLGAMRALRGPRRWTGAFWAESSPKHWRLGPGASLVAKAATTDLPCPCRLGAVSENRAHRPDFSRAVLAGDLQTSGSGWANVIMQDPDAPAHNGTTGTRPGCYLRRSESAALGPSDCCGL